MCKWDLWNCEHCSLSEQHGPFPDWCVARTRPSGNEAGPRGSGPGRNSHCFPLVSGKLWAKPPGSSPSHIPCILSFVPEPTKASNGFHDPPTLLASTISTEPQSSATLSWWSEPQKHRQEREALEKDVNESPNHSTGWISWITVETSRKQGGSWAW